MRYLFNKFKAIYEVTSISVSDVMKSLSEINERKYNRKTHFISVDSCKDIKQNECYRGILLNTFYKYLENILELFKNSIQNIVLN